MNIESKWISLKSDDIAPETSPTDARWAKESASPYDIPTHVRSYYDPSRGILSIEFRYISSEEVTEVAVKPYFQLVLGKRTKRIYAIHFDIHNFNRDKQRIAKETRDNIESYVGAKEPNRDITIRAIAKKQQSLFSAVA
jgi:hypothetical protein